VNCYTLGSQQLNTCNYFGQLEERDERVKKIAQKLSSGKKTDRRTKDLEILWLVKAG